MVFESDRASVKESLKNERLKSRAGKVYIQLSSRDQAERSREERALAVNADPPYVRDWRQMRI